MKPYFLHRATAGLTALALLFASSLGDGAPKSGERTELASTGWTTLKGKVLYDGDPPAPGDFKDSMKGNKDSDYCHKGDTEDPTWTVGPNKGVAYVVVWLRPPAAKFFKIKPEQKKRTDVVTVDQPYCAFKPHVVTLFPSYWDPCTGQQQPTGQVFKVLNSAAVAHNVLWSGNPLVNPGGNVLVPPTKPGEKITEYVVPVRAGRTGREDLINLRCNLHLWMAARAWVFDHPYAAVTREDGSYEIKDVPAGVELTVVGWHEGVAGNWVLPAGKGGRAGEPIQPLQAGESREFTFKIHK